MNNGARARQEIQCRDIGSSVALFFFHVPLPPTAKPGRGNTRACMKEFAKAFYGSEAWKDCREAYKHSVGFLCESCKRKGILKAGDTVHHKIHLTPENINNPDITLNFANLELVCRDCHAEIHRKKERRYKVDALGHVIISE